MVTGLIHSHSGLAYLLLLSTSISLVVSVVNAAIGSRAGLVRFGTILGRRVEPALMGIIALIGIGTWVMMPMPLMSVYLWIGVVAVVAQGMLVGKGLKPVLVALDGGDDSVRWRWPAVAFVHSLLIYGVFGLMHAY